MINIHYKERFERFFFGERFVHFERFFTFFGIFLGFSLIRCLLTKVLSSQLHWVLKVTFQFRWCTGNKQRLGLKVGTRALEWVAGNQERGSCGWRSCCHDGAYRGKPPHGWPQAPLRRTLAGRQRRACCRPPAGCPSHLHRVALATAPQPSWSAHRPGLQPRSISWLQNPARCPKPPGSWRSRHLHPWWSPVHRSQGQRDTQCTPRKCPLGNPNLRGWHQTRCRGPASKEMDVAFFKLAVPMSTIASMGSLINIESLLLSIDSLIFRLDFSVATGWLRTMKRAGLWTRLS